MWQEGRWAEPWGSQALQEEERKEETEASEGRAASGKAWELVGTDFGRDANGAVCCVSFRGSLRSCFSPFHSWYLPICSRSPSRKGKGPDL